MQQKNRSQSGHFIGRSFTTDKTTIVIPTTTGLWFGRSADIVYFFCFTPESGAKSEWRMVTVNHETKSIRKSVSGMQILRIIGGYGFFAISQSVIVNLLYMSHIEYTNRICRLCHPFERLQFHVSRRQLSDIQKVVNHF